MPFLAAVPAVAAAGGGAAAAGAGAAAVGAGGLAAGAGTAAVAGGATVGSLAGITAGTGAGAAFGGAFGGASIAAGATGATGAMGAMGAAGAFGGASMLGAGAGAAGAGSSMMGMIGKGMNLAGSMSGMMGSLQQGSAINAAGQANADVARANAKIAEEEGHKKAAQIEGAQRSGYAKGGVDTSTGTPLAVIATSVRDAELEGLREKYKWLYQADQLEAQGKAAQSGGVFGALTKGLGGAGTFLGSMAKIDPTLRYDWGREGMLGRMFGG